MAFRICLRRGGNDQEGCALKEDNFCGAASVGKYIEMPRENFGIGDQCVDDV